MNRRGPSDVDDHRARAPIRHVHFIETGVASVVAKDDGGGAVEVATIGNEGFVGTPLLLGTDRSPSAAFCQVPGHGYRMTASALQTEVRRNGDFSAIAHRLRAGADEPLCAVGRL